MKTKAYTDIKQSKLLTEILPLDSADMYYINGGDKSVLTGWWVECGHDYNDIPCWSLAALLGVLPKIINHNTLFIETSPALWHIGYRNIYTARADNPVDACYEMILKLHELKML